MRNLLCKAKNYYDLITNAGELRDDFLLLYLFLILLMMELILILSIKLYSSGKMLDKTVNIDGLFSYIIYSERYIR